MREKKVVVAIVQDDQGRFLVHFNPKWGGYAFPMMNLEASADVLGSVAIRALEDDLGCKLPCARAEEMEYLGRFGRSGRTGADTEYEYWLYAVDPHQPLDLLAAPTWNNNPPMFLSFTELSSRTDLTWSASEIVHEFVESQEVVLSVITRPGEEETEFLLVWNHSYAGYFFPSQRVKTEAKPEAAAIGTVHNDLGYKGPAKAVLRGEVADDHFSSRFHRDRRYRLHICAVQLPEVDLHQPCSPLLRKLEERGKHWLWLSASQLQDRGVTPALLREAHRPKQLASPQDANRPIIYSPTMAAVLPAVLQQIPRQAIAAPLRKSEGAIALFERQLAGQTEWLVQWNENWKAFFFVGGHRLEAESFRACACREVGEELGLAASDFEVASRPDHHLEYKALSQSAGELTAYTMEMFASTLTPRGMEIVECNHENRWLSEKEVLRLEAHDARPVSPTVHLLLCMAGRIR